MVSGRWDWGQIVEWKSLLFVLSILFICMAAVAAFQLARIFYYRQTTPPFSLFYLSREKTNFFQRHRILSYHIGFLSLVFLWGVIRFFFFLLITAWSPMVYLVLYWYKYFSKYFSNFFFNFFNFFFFLLLKWKGPQLFWNLPHFLCS